MNFGGGFMGAASASNLQQMQMQQAAREMGLRLVEFCQQVNVYGPVWTEGMWAEINHAERLGIPVLTDQKELGKPPHRRTKQGKER